MMIKRSSSLITSSYLNYPATKKIIRILEEDYSIDPDDYSAILKTVDNYLKSVNSSKKMQIKSSAGSSLSRYQKDLISDIVKAEIESGNPLSDYDEVYNMIVGDFDDDFSSVIKEATDYYFDLLDCSPSCVYDKSDSDDSYMKNYDDVEYALASSKSKKITSSDDFDEQEPEFDLESLQSTVNLIKQNYPCYADSEAKVIAQDFNLNEKEAEYVLSQLKGESIRSSEEEKSKRKSKYNGCNVTGRENGMAPQVEPVASSFGLF